jgi:HNH endonuclease
MTIPKNINRENIIEAIKKIDREGVPERRESTRFNLSYNGNYYPPKYVISVSNIFANGEEYSPSLFSGGEETNKYLSKLGFTIIENETNLTDDQKWDVLINVPDEAEQIEVTKTEKDQVIKSRIGQSIFKKDLASIDKKCRLCGVSDERFLVASHIKPWSKSNNQERLDVNNGLLFCPNHDALFDKGYISFNENGIILISTSLNESEKVFLNINETMKIEMNERQQGYMKWHRKNLFNS